MLLYLYITENLAPSPQVLVNYRYQRELVHTVYKVNFSRNTGVAMGNLTARPNEDDITVPWYLDSLVLGQEPSLTNGNVCFRFTASF
jgi:hypothetical protein